MTDSASSKRIALLEDSQNDARLVRHCVEHAGHVCRVYGTARALMDGLRQSTFDLLIMDWTLPDIDGDEVLGWVRREIGWDLPVIFVSARAGAEDITAMLEAGADDYLTKPFDLNELLARITAITRRTGLLPNAAPRLEIGPFTLDGGAQRLSRDGITIELTRKEFHLAELLLRNIGKLLARADILHEVWGYGPEVRTRTLDIHMSRLRKKLRLDREHGWHLASVYHEGYRLECTGESATTPEPVDSSPEGHGHADTR